MNTRPGRDRTHALILAASLIAGFLSAAAAAVAVASEQEESVVGGAVLLGFGVGWALLAGLTARFSDRPERWAAVPAVAMALAGTSLLAFAPDTEAMTTIARLGSPLVLGLVVWMVVQVRRQPHGRARSFLLYPVFAVLALSAAGCGYDAVLSTTERQAPLAGGQRLVDVGGHRLAIACTGSGSPTVVLEPGLGESARSMARLIAPSVARTTRICVYDQAGHGRSDEPSQSRTDAARDLRVLLERSRIPGPYVIAGHSLGGIHALNFARRYPGHLAGVVLLDSMSPQQTSTFEGADPLLDLLPLLARTGLARLLTDPEEGEPVAQTREFVRDVKAMPHQLDDAAELTSLGSVPLMVVTAAKGGQAGWAADQDVLARLSTTSEHRTVPGSTHASLVEDTDDAAESSRAIRDLVEAVRRTRARRA